MENIKVLYQKINDHMDSYYIKIIKNDTYVKYEKIIIIHKCVKIIKIY